MNRRMRNVILSLILVLTMVLGVIPGTTVSSYAEEADQTIVLMEDSETDAIVDEAETLAENEDEITNEDETFTETEEALAEEETEPVPDETVDVDEETDMDEEVAEETAVSETAAETDDEDEQVLQTAAETDDEAGPALQAAEETDDGDKLVLQADTTLKADVDSMTLEVGNTHQLKVTYNGSTVTSSCYFGSSDSEVASVTTGGLVKGILAGSAYITIMYPAKGLTAEIPVSVVKKTTEKNVRYNVLIMDASDSVKGTPLKREKAAAKRFCKTILAADGDNYLAVISLNSDATVVCKMTSSYTKLANAIDSISCKYGTNLNSAMKKAKSILDGCSDGAKVLKNVVICSDGLPQCGTTKASGKYKSSDHKYYKYANAVYATDVAIKKAGYFVYSLGFYNNSKGKSLNFGRRHMKDLASKDKYYEVSGPDDIDDAMDDISEQITKLTISKTSQQIYLGKTSQLSAYLNGVKVAASWSTSDSSVATVDANGCVTGLKAGTATITAQYDGGKVTCKVSVYNAPSITLSKSSITIYKGCTATLKASVTGISKSVTWKSSDKSIAKVSKSGVVTGVKKGTCTITATCNGVKASCKVSVLNPTITLNETKVYLYKGDTVNLKATVKGKSSKVTWSSTKKSVATVSSSGVVKAKKLGTTYIVAKCNGVTAKCKVIVEKKHPAYSFYCETNKAVTRIGTKKINEMGAMLKYNDGAKITKAAVYIYKSGGYSYFIVACRGENLTSVECDCYLGLNGKKVYDYYNTNSNSLHMNHFYFSKDSNGVYSLYGRYDNIRFNTTDTSGKLLTIKKTGADNKHFRVFTNLQKMKDWLNKE